VLFGAVGVVMLVLAVILLVDGKHPAHPLQVTITTLLGAAMGVQAAAARFIAVKDVTTVVVTSTITGLASDSVLGSGKRDGSSGRRALAVVLILLGAMAGAALLHWQLGAGLLLAAAVVLGATLVGALHARARLHVRAQSAVAV
jgi:uncharacterized membrane protein YoaK (UPF0700 family)